MVLQSPAYMPVKHKKKKKKHALNPSHSTSQLVGSHLPSKVLTPKENCKFVTSANHSPSAGVIFAVTNIGHGQNAGVSLSSARESLVSEMEAKKVRSSSLDRKDGCHLDRSDSSKERPLVIKQPQHHNRKTIPKKKLEDYYKKQSPGLSSGPNVVNHNGVEMNGHVSMAGVLNGHFGETVHQTSNTVSKKGNKSQKSSPNQGGTNTLHLMNGKGLDKGNKICDSRKRSIDSIIYKSKKRSSLTGKWHQE